MYLQKRAKTAKKGQGAIFPGLAGKEAAGPRRKWARSEFTAILEAAGVDRKGNVTFHSLRHTWRTNLRAAGVADELVMKLGGWAAAIGQKRGRRLNDADPAVLGREISQ